jgi:hypothetical protein
VDEEKQLLGVLKEYKAKYQEYEKATKSSKKSHGTYQKELKGLDLRKKQLAQDQRRLVNKLGIEDANDTDGVAAQMADLEVMEKDWEEEKQKLNEEIEQGKL